MKIIKFMAENFKRLKVVTIVTGDDPVIQISGKNAQGKSSTIDAIWAALRGPDVLKNTPKPIREGEKTAKITLDIGDYKVTRSFKGPNSYLTVTTADGSAKITSPQKMLDGLMGNFSFDPLAFTRMNDRDQAGALMKMLGIDVTDLDNERKQVFEERTGINRDLKRSQAELEATPRVIDPPERVDVHALMEKYCAVVDENKKGDDLKERARQAKFVVNNIEEIIKDHEKALKEAKATLDEKEKELELSSPPDIEPLKNKLDSAEETNKKADQAERREGAVKKYREIEIQASHLSGKLAAIDETKSKMLNDVKMPVEGLRINPETGFLEFNDIPLKQSARSEQLRVAASIAMAQHPELRIMRIEDGSLLDDEAMEVLRDLAISNDYQLWVEIVDDSGEIGIHIEDGEIAGERND